MLSVGHAVTTHVETDKITVDDVIVTNDVNSTEFYQNGNKVLDTTDNTTMTNYVNAQDTAYNDSMKTYVDARDVVFNSSMKTYVDARDTTFNDSMKTYVDGQDTLYNSTMKTYVDAVVAALSTVYCALAGCTMAGDIAMGGNDVTGIGDVNGTNINATGTIRGHWWDNYWEQQENW